MFIRRAHLGVRRLGVHDDHTVLAVPNGGLRRRSATSLCGYQAADILLVSEERETRSCSKGIQGKHGDERVMRPILDTSRLGKGRAIVCLMFENSVAREARFRGRCQLSVHHVVLPATKEATRTRRDIEAGSESEGGPRFIPAKTHTE